MNTDKLVVSKNQEIAIRDCVSSLRGTLQKMRDAKPDERSELARRFSVAITELEKVYSYFIVYVELNDNA